LISGVIEIIGIGLEPELLPSQVDRLYAADYLIGSDRLLSCFPDFPEQKLRLGNLLQTIAAIKQIIENEPEAKIVILASGDPLFFGIGRLLLAHFSPEKLQFHPSVSSIQLAFARLKIPWQDAAVISAHGRSLQELEKSLRQGKQHIAVLTDAVNHPVAIANFISALQLPINYQIWVCENLGGKNERVTDLDLAALIESDQIKLGIHKNDRLAPPDRIGQSEQDIQTDQFGQVESTDLNDRHNSGSWPEQLKHDRKFEFAPLNVVVLVKQENERSLDLSQLPIVGIPDQYFYSFPDQPGLITKREIRSLAIGELALQPEQLIWDIGAGTGSLSIEIARLVPTARIHAIEKTAAGATLIAKNMARFQVSNIEIHQGKAPEILAKLPNPDRVFIGGSSGELTAILQVCGDRFRKNGILVANFASPEHLHRAMAWLKKHNYPVQLLQVNLARSVPIGSVSRFSPLNPITILKTYLS
jgi:precorrin-6Y C5,15-methyltransferase (decarboxylating)